MTVSRVAFIDIYPIHFGPQGVRFLTLRRASTMPRQGSWEGVHGSIETGETPVDAAHRELMEETGLIAEPLYNLSRVEHFYLHRSDEIALIPGFVALVAEAPILLSSEHDSFEWLSPQKAAERYTWPRMAKGVADVMRLFGNGIPPWLDAMLRT